MDKLEKSLTEEETFRPDWELLTHRLLRKQEEDRRRLARHLHDDVTQLLATISMRLHVAGKTPDDEVRTLLEKCLGIVEMALNHLRKFAFELRPTALDHFGLVVTLQRLVDGHTNQGGPAIHLETGFGDERLPPEVETACFRMAEEALLNSIQHADAQEIRIVLRKDSDRLFLSICDDGTGFDYDGSCKGSTQPPGFGLHLLQTRAYLVRGCCTIRSAPGKGTQISVEIPLG